MHEKNPLATVSALNGKPAAPQQLPTPWDPEPLKGRSCATCACHFQMANAQDPTKPPQSFCRRLPADLTQMRMETPRLDREQRPVIKDGRPVMNSEVVTGYQYKPTLPGGICFDGYRPLGTLPGQNEQQRQLSSYLAILREHFTSSQALDSKAIKKLLDKLHAVNDGAS